MTISKYFLPFENIYIFFLCSWKVSMCALGQFYMLLLGSTLSTFTMRPFSLTGSWGHPAYFCNVWSLKHWVANPSYVSQAKPIEFLLTQEQSTFIGFPFKACTIHGVFPSTLPHFGVGKNRCLLSSASLSSGPHKSPKLESWQVRRIYSRKLNFRSNVRRQSKTIINQYISKTMKTKTNKTNK